MDLIPLKELPKLPKLTLAVVGHVEWVNFFRVDNYPQPGVISKGEKYQEGPAGGGAVAALEMARLTASKVQFFTALGKDSIGERSVRKLEELGLQTSIAWRDQPTRTGISMIDNKGERAITVIGERLQPLGKDHLPWSEMMNFDGVFITATDSEALKKCRKAKIMVGTPRIGLNNFEESNIKLNALIGSALDPYEKALSNSLKHLAKITISTEGALGGEVLPGGRFEAFKLKSSIIDTYGCGDCFAAGFTTGLAAGWNVEQSISLGAHCGARCIQRLGPYKSQDY